MRESDEHRPTAGLPLSVGKAPLALRLVIALVFATAAAICGWGGALVARVALVPAIVLIEPIAIAGVVAAIYITAPLSRFGVWLDHFLPRLRERRVGGVVAVVVWMVAAAVVIVSNA